MSDTVTIPHWVFQMEYFGAKRSIKIIFETFIWVSNSCLRRLSVRAIIGPRDFLPCLHFLFKVRMNCDDFVSLVFVGDDDSFDFLVAKFQIRVLCGLAQLIPFPYVPPVKTIKAIQCVPMLRRHIAPFTLLLQSLGSPHIVIVRPCFVLVTVLGRRLTQQRVSNRALQIWKKFQKVSEFLAIKGSRFEVGYTVRSRHRLREPAKLLTVFVTDHFCERTILVDINDRRQMLRQIRSLVEGDNVATVIVTMHRARLQRKVTEASARERKVTLLFILLAPRKMFYRVARPEAAIF